MGMQQKLINKYAIILVSIGIIVIISYCGQDTQQGNVAYGKEIYYEHCMGCHFPNAGIHEAPSLYALNKCDSQALISKLKNVKYIKKHGTILDSIKYSNKEIKSIYLFVRNYFSPQPEGQ